MTNQYVFHYGQKRLQKELMAIQKDPPPGVVVDMDNIGSNLTQYVLPGGGVLVVEGLRHEMSPSNRSMVD